MPAEDEDENLCVICLDRPKTYLLFPCGHRCVCEECRLCFEPGATLMPGQKRILECPKCRDKVSKTVRVWD